MALKDLDFVVNSTMNSKAPGHGSREGLATGRSSGGFLLFPGNCTLSEEGVLQAQPS
jgi:hypothetical protein